MKNTRMITYSALSAAFSTLCSWISIPIGAVPVTLQILALFLVAFLFGARVGLYSTLTWILLGLVGLPVFAGFSGGLSTLMGPTAGFIWAFVPSVYLAGKAAESSPIKGVVLAFLTLFLLVYPLGTWQLMRITGMNLQGALALAVYPFVLFDVIKIGLAHAIHLVLQRSGLSRLA